MIRQASSFGNYLRGMGSVLDFFPVEVTPSESIGGFLLPADFTEKVSARVECYAKCKLRLYRSRLHRILCWFGWHRHTCPHGRCQCCGRWMR